MSKRNVFIGIILLIVVVGAFLATGGSNPLAPKSTPTPVAAFDELDYLVTASGTLLPIKRANLGFTVPGKIVKVEVAENDVVKPGAVLARLEAAELEAAVAAARAQLAQLKAGPTKEDIAIAQATLANAQAQLAKVRAPVVVEDVAIARAALESTAAIMRDAQSQYDRVRNDPQVGMYPESQKLHLATQEYRIAEARYKQVTKGAIAEDVRIAESAVNVAQANMNRVQAGARPEEIAAAQARLDQALAALNATILTAPFGGTIAALNAREGETVAPGVSVITLGDLSALRLETDDLSETSIARVKIGQSVTVTFEALSGKKFNGTVLSIAPIASAKQGGTNYTVTVQVEKLDPVLRWGMTGHVEINTR
ncbi:MAG: efflux RND transporter periplasmic adaptor subunit [Chloroflexi bacterium]|nr:efflux RND transporter periplasmic adaptor subunit [Chloroflexota bacterium]